MAPLQAERNRGSRSTVGGVRGERWAQKDGGVRWALRQNRWDLQEDQPNLSLSFSQGKGDSSLVFNESCLCKSM